MWMKLNASVIAQAFGTIINERLNWKDYLLYMFWKGFPVIKIFADSVLNLLLPSVYLYNIDILNKLQKRAIRIICPKTKTHTESLFKEIKYWML